MSNDQERSLYNMSMSRDPEQLQGTDIPIQKHRPFKHTYVH